MWKKPVCIAIAAIVGLSLVSPANAQQWDKQQKEVWKAVKALHDTWRALKIKEGDRYIHSDFTGWYPEDPFPSTKRQNTIWSKYIKATRNIRFFLVHPVRMVVKGNTAIAQYHTAQMSVTRKGHKEKYSTIQWTDAWIREGGRWLLLATHGTRVEQK